MKCTVCGREPRDREDAENWTFDGFKSDHCQTGPRFATQSYRDAGCRALGCWEFAKGVVTTSFCCDDEDCMAKKRLMNRRVMGDKRAAADLERMGL